MTRNILCWIEFTSAFWIFVSIIGTPTATSDIIDGSSTASCNCYSRAVHDELLKVIDFVNAHTYTEQDVSNHQKLQSSQLPKKFQEEEDYGIDNPFDVPSINSIVPTIFKLVGSAIALNSSGLVEGSFGLLPERVSNQITSALGTLASSFLGPSVLPTTTRRTPPRRRRTRTTTTTIATPMEAEVLAENRTTTESSLEPLNSTTSTEETRGNETLLMDIMSNTETTTEEVPTTTEVLFKESSLGENPVYAAAYAPNYVATTSYPIYASNYLHVLYPAPTTTTVATTTTEITTSTDPNSYAIALPFDYMEGIGIGTGTPPIVIREENSSTLPNVTYPPVLPNTPDYEYEYEEQTEGGKEKRESNEKESNAKFRSLYLPVSQTKSHVSASQTGNQLKKEDEDDEYQDNGFNINHSLGGISSSRVL